MTDTIQYAEGKSSPGRFYAALSTEGLVAFEFVEPGDDVASMLRARFPDTELVLNQQGMEDVIEKLGRVIVDPAYDPGIPLDIRGSDYQKRVWSLLRELKPGEKTTYGAIAAKMGEARDARAATKAITENNIAILIPCHRVVKKDGSLSGYRWGPRRKQYLLDREHKEPVDSGKD